MHEFAPAVAAQTGLAEEQALAALRAFLHEVVNALIRDGRVQLAHFGIFELITRKGRRGRNPRTGERLSIPDRVRVRFRAARALEKALDSAPPPSSAGEEPGGARGDPNREKRWWQLWP
jgi:DNA-binding protein HU-beta